MPRKPKPRLKTLGAILVVAFLMWLVPVWLANRDLSAEIDRAKADHIPLTFAEFSSGPQVSQADNAAPYYAAAIAKFVRRPDPEDRGIGENDARYRPAIHEMFRQNKSAIDLLIKAAAKPHCNFAYFLPEDASRAVDNSSKIFQIFRLVTLEADAQSADGHPIAALQLLGNVARVGFHVAETSDAVSLLSGAANTDSIFQSVKSVLLDHGHEPGVTEAAQKVALSCTCSPDLERIIELDNLATLAGLTDGAAVRARGVVQPGAFENYDKFSTAGRLAAPPHLTALYASTLIPGMLARWRLTQWRLALAEVTLVRNSKGNSESLVKPLTDAYKGACQGIDGLFTAQAGADMGYLAADIPHVLANRRMTLQAIAAFADWNKTGVIPPELPLTGEAATDPNTGKPLTYAVTETGFRIAFKGQQNSLSQRDIIFRYPRGSGGPGR